MEKNPVHPVHSAHMVRLILATRNAYKTHEFAEILGPGFVVSDLNEVKEIPRVKETGETFEENAILKAGAISSCFPGLVVSDDSGLGPTVFPPALSRSANTPTPKRGAVATSTPRASCATAPSGAPAAQRLKRLAVLRREIWR